MAMKCICDGCGKEASASSNGVSWFKPDSWYERTPEGEKIPITACSRKCISTIEEKRKEDGKKSTEVVLPI